MAEPLLYSARQAAAALGIDESTFNRMLRTGEIPDRIQHRAFAGAKCRKYSRVLLERWAAGELDDSGIEPFRIEQAS